MQAQIKGTTMPTLEMILEDGETVVSEHGEFSWMTPNVQMTQTTGASGMMSKLKRVAGGGGLFLTEYTAGGGQAMLTFATHLPGTIFPINIEPSGGYVVHRAGWICGTTGVTPSVALQQTFRGGLFGGEGFILQKLEGQGQAWVQLSGEITTYDLQEGQSLMVHPGHIGLFEDKVRFDVRMLPGLKNKVFGGDGFFVVHLSGPGKIWLQSLTLPGLAGALQPYLTLPQQGGGGGGLLGGVLGGNI